MGTQGRQYVMTGLRKDNMNMGGPEANNVLVDHLCTQKKIVKTTLTYGCYNNTFLEAKVTEICAESFD